MRYASQNILLGRPRYLLLNTVVSLVLRAPMTFLSSLGKINKKSGVGSWARYLVRIPPYAIITTGSFSRPSDSYCQSSPCHLDITADRALIQAIRSRYRGLIASFVPALTLLHPKTELWNSVLNM